MLRPTRTLRLQSLAPLGAALALSWGTLACSGPRPLETRLGGRSMEDLRAEALKVEGRWQVTLKLPAGRWRVETAEGQELLLEPGEPRGTLRWKVAPDRWSQQDRPFRFDLVGEDGLRLSLSVTYPNTLPGGNFMLDVFRVLSGK